jgi:Rrf2 family nitric oxide-sensitive transcriptional repressor
VTLTKFSDYSLRLLIYLAVHTDRPVSVGEVSRAYGISPHIVVKVVQLLVQQGLIASVRGRRGGLRLNRDPGAINIGQVIRTTEPGWDLVECFDAATNTCPIATACGMKGVLKGAQRAFLGVLDDHTLADFLPQAPALVRLLHRSLEEAHSRDLRS